MVDNVAPITVQKNSFVFTEWTVDETCALYNPEKESLLVAWIRLWRWPHSTAAANVSWTYMYWKKKKINYLDFKNIIEIYTMLCKRSGSVYSLVYTMLGCWIQKKSPKAKIILCHIITKQAKWLPINSPSPKKHMTLPGFEPRSTQPQPTSDDLHRSAMGPTCCFYDEIAGPHWNLKLGFSNIILLHYMIKLKNAVGTRI